MCRVETRIVRLLILLQCIHLSVSNTMYVALLMIKFIPSRSTTAVLVIYKVLLRRQFIRMK